MARTLIGTFLANPSGSSGAFYTAGDVANGMKVLPGGRLVLWARNTDATPRNVTLVLPPPPDTADAADRVVSIPAGSTRAIGPFPGNMYTQPTDANPEDIGFIHINVDSGLLSLLALRA